MTQALAASLLAFAVVAPLPVSAAEKVVQLTLDGRPVARSGVVAVSRDGLVYADVIDLVKSFDGLLTLHGDAVVVSIRAKTATLTAGSRTMKINQGSIVMPGQAFKRGGEIFVPLEAFVRNVAGAKVTIDAAQSHADIAVSAAP